MKISNVRRDSSEFVMNQKDFLGAIKKTMTDQQHVVNMAELFKVLGDTTRVSILAALSVSELCVCDIASLLGMSNSAISHQLRVLKQTHIVRSRREGKTVFYRMADEHITQLLGIALEHSGEEQVK